MARKKYGGIYVLTNSAMPGIVKIGQSDDIESRIKQHNASNIPFPFDCYYARQLENCDKISAVEKNIHNAFKKFKVNRKEFFSILYEDKEPLNIWFGKAETEKCAEILAECVKAALSLIPGKDITEEINDALPEESNEPLINLMQEMRGMNVKQKKERTKEIMVMLDEQPKININAKTRQGVTPLSLSAGLNLKSICEKLLSLNANPNTATAQGITPLMKAARHADRKIVDMLLRKVSSENINAVSKKGESALDYAAGKKRKAAADKIKKAGGKTGKELAPPEPEEEE